MHPTILQYSPKTHLKYIKQNFSIKNEYYNKKDSVNNGCMYWMGTTSKLDETALRGAKTLKF